MKDMIIIVLSAIIVGLAFRPEVKPAPEPIVLLTTPVPTTPVARATPPPATTAPFVQWRLDPAHTGPLDERPAKQVRRGFGSYIDR